MIEEPAIYFVKFNEGCHIKPHLPVTVAESCGLTVVPGVLHASDPAKLPVVGIENDGNVNLTDK